MTECTLKLEAKQTLELLLSGFDHSNKKSN